MSITFDATYPASPTLKFPGLAEAEKVEAGNIGLDTASSSSQCGYYLLLDGGSELVHLKACPQVMQLCVPGLRL